MTAGSGLRAFALGAMVRWLVFGALVLACVLGLMNAWAAVDLAPLGPRQVREQWVALANRYFALFVLAGAWAAVVLVWNLRWHRRTGK
jgi:hypothetical protein